MNWYYLDKGQEAGPLSKDEMQALVKSGTIVRDTQVRNEKSTNWITYGQLLESAGKKRQQQTQPAQASQSAPQTASPQSTLPSQGGRCTECGGEFAADELLSYQDAKVCASCKPVFFQKLKEGVAETTFMNYAGFWRRFGAKIIDSIILSAGNMVIGLVAGFIFTPSADASTNPEDVNAMVAGGIILLYFFQIAIAAGYTSFFLGKYASTPGKMALGIKVVRSNGESISYLRAFGRYFAEMLSGIILGIGYLMAAFDKEKRALHDHICDSRVVFK